MPTAIAVLASDATRARQWDGEMITTILIVLVAVVVLIVIIAFLALRYLRADDSDTFDDIPDEPRRPRRAADPEPGPLPVGPDRRPRQRGAVTEARVADRPVRAVDSRGQSGYRDRETGPRPAVPERAGSQPSPRRAPAGAVAAASRPARSARLDDPDAMTNSWDSLSDVDYWAELAADKPQITPTTAGPALAARRGAPEPSSDPRPAGPLAGARGDHGGSPVQPRQQAARLGGPPPGRAAELFPAAAASLDAAGRRGGPRPVTAPRAPAAQRPTTGARPPRPSQPQAPAAPVEAGNGHSWNGRPADDDPLTSPSFPAINTADSRSYRTRRSAASQPGGADQTRYPAGRDRISRPDRTSRPDGYPVQSAAAATVPPAAKPASSGAPAANPYGSYVSAAQPVHSPHGYPEAAAPSLPGTDYPGYPIAAQPTIGTGTWYSTAALEAGAAVPSAADGYLPAAGNGTSGAGSAGHVHNGSAPRGYAGIDYTSLRYDDPAYPDPSAAGLVGYAASQPTAQYEQPGYSGPDLGYGPDGQQGYPGYGADRR